MLWFFYLYADSLYQTPRRVAIKAPQYSLLDSVPAVVDAAVAQNDTSSLAGDWEGRRECVSLMNRGGEKAMYHWIILNLGALWKYFRRGSVVDVYVGDWLTVGGASRYHNESMQFFAGDFFFPWGAAAGPGAVREPPHCAPEYGTDLWADDRPDPESHVFLRGLIARALARAPRAPPAFNASLMVYVTRAGRPSRSVLNEDAFLPALAALGVQRVQLEDYSFEEKVRLFASARLVISPQSASLTYVVAADRRALVIEIFQDVDQMNHYKFAAADLRIPYRRFSQLQVVGDTVPIFNAPFNFIVDAPALVDFVQKAILETAALAAGPPVRNNVTELIDEKYL